MQNEHDRGEGGSSRSSLDKYKNMNILISKDVKLDMYTNMQIVKYANIKMLPVIAMMLHASMQLKAKIATSQLRLRLRSVVPSDGAKGTGTSPALPEL